MYNLSCDPQSLTEERLKSQVRCPDCAARIARHKQRRLGEADCGVFPLGRTLQRRDEAASRPGPLLYCYEPGCENYGHPPAMYNTSSNPAKTSLEELVGRVRCPDCAARIAHSKQRQLGEAGCGVFPLAYTMRQAGWVAGTAEDQRLTSLSDLLHRLPRVEVSDET
jgi:ssDNA-binding Zn-finger/Zn-ribbon topoisomerase 1